MLECWDVTVVRSLIVEMLCVKCLGVTMSSVRLSVNPPESTPCIQGIPGSMILLDEATSKYSLARKVVLPEHQRMLVLKLCEVGAPYT